MCWSRKGVPGSKRSGEAGTPFLGPAAEPNFRSERAAGSSDGGPPHERRANGPPIRRPAQEDRRSHQRLYAALSADRRRETSSLSKERGQVVLDQAWLTDGRLLAKRRRKARRSPHHPVTGEDLLAASK